MARIKVKHLQTGETGTIDEKDFSPQLFERQKGVLEKIVTSKSLPYLAGGLAGSAVFPVSGGLGSIPAAAMTGGATYGVQRSLASLLGYPMQNTDLGGFAKTTGLSGANEVLGIGVSKLLSKLVGPVLSKFGPRTPAGMEKGIEAVQQTAGRKVGEEGTKAAAVKLSLKETLDALRQQLQKPEVVMNPAAQQKILKVMADVSKTGGSVPGVSGLRTMYGQNIWGEAGKELSKRGATGIAEKTAMKTAGGLLEGEIKSKVPTLVDPMKTYSAASRLATDMKLPFKNWWMGGLAGGLLAGPESLGVVPAGATAVASPLVSLLAMPYTRNLLKQTLATPGAYGGLPLKTILSLIEGSGE